MREFANVMSQISKEKKNLELLLRHKKNLSSEVNRNKNTLTRPANCKKSTRHHTHPDLSLYAKSRKTNDAKSRKWPKTSVWAIF